MLKKTAKTRRSASSKQKQPLYTSSDVIRAQPLDSNQTFDTKLGIESELRRDYARLIHSPSFRRLQGKTQLFPGTESDFFRNRLTHSLEVAQIAKGIAIHLNQTERGLASNPINTDLVESAGLAHDIGHPPFGHNGEYALDQCMLDHGGFEGNAQTLRIVTRLEKKERSSDADKIGLNLTYRTIAALLKYDNEIPAREADRSDKKLAKGYYHSEKNLINKIKHAVCGDQPIPNQFRTIECDIMDIADDIAYSTYDLDDALKAEFLNPLEILSYFSQENFIRDITSKVNLGPSEKKATEQEVFETALETFGGFIVDQFQNADISDSQDVVFKVVRAYTQSKKVASDGHTRNSLTSALVKEFIANVRIEFNQTLPALSKIILPRETKIKIETLKHLAYQTLIMSPRLKLVEYRGKEIIKTLFESLTSKDGHLLLPDDWRDQYLSMRKDADKKRLACDFIAGMTDRFAVEFYSKLSSAENTQSFFKPF